jgi:hypothetical protein
VMATTDDMNPDLIPNLFSGPMEKGKDRVGPEFTSDLA